MAEKMKSFMVECAKCRKSFPISFPLVDPSAEGSAEVAVVCPHCHEQVIVTIPAPYLPPGEDLVRE